MFVPKFRYTTAIVNELSLIERLYGQLISEKLIPSLSLKLLEENQLLATHYSTSIEGNPLTPMDVTNIILGDKVPTTKSEKEVKNYFAVLNSINVLAKKNTPISIDLTQKLHHQLMQGIEEKDLPAHSGLSSGSKTGRQGLGAFRDSGVFVGHKTKAEIVVKHNPPFHTRKDIEHALQELYDWLLGPEELHPMLKAGIFHHQFAYVHPFLDGNGRLARVLTSYYLLLKEYFVTKYFILDDFYDIDRSLYSDTLHTADRGDKTEWLEYFLEGIVYSLQSALGRIEDLKKKTLDQLEGEKRVLVSAREEDVLEIVIDKKAVKTSDIQNALSVTRQQAHALLYSLVKKGILEKYGSTKTSYYKLKGKSSSDVQ